MAVENEHERSPGSDVACGKTLFTTHLAGHLSCAASRAMSGQPGPVRHNGSIRLVGLHGPVQSGASADRPLPGRAGGNGTRSCSPLSYVWSRTLGHACLVTHVWLRMSVWVSKGTCHGSRTAGQAFQGHPALPSLFPTPGPFRQASTKGMGMPWPSPPAACPAGRLDIAFSSCSSPDVSQLSRPGHTRLPTRTRAPPHPEHAGIRSGSRLQPRPRRTWRAPPRGPVAR